MATVTVRLDEGDVRLLDQLAAEHGGRSAALRHAIHLASGKLERDRAADRFLKDWEAEFGPLDPAEVEATAKRFGL